MHVAWLGEGDMSADGIRALLFDVFGTIVDWRSSIIEEGRRNGPEWGVDVDWEKFADHWRSLYQSSMEPIRSGQQPWENLDSLHLGKALLRKCRGGIHLVNPAW